MATSGAMRLLSQVFNMGKPLLRLLFPRALAYSDAKDIVHSNSANARDEVSALLRADPTIVCPDGRGNILFEMAAANRRDMIMDVLQCAR